MDIVDVVDGEIDRLQAHGLPDAWRRDPQLARVGSVADLIWAIRECDARSDALLRALVGRGPGDATAAVVVLAALMKLRLARCRGAQDRMAALLSELAIVLGEAWVGEFDVSRPRLAGAMVDRAWGKARRAERYDTETREPAFSADGDRGFEDDGHAAVECERAIAATRAYLARTASRGSAGNVGVVRAWNVYTRLLDQEERSTRERNQIKHARRVLRRTFTPDLEPVGWAV